MAALHDDIRSEAAKLIERYESYARQLADERKRRERRTTAVVQPLHPTRPKYWSIAQGFDPYLVRARCERIGHSISRSIRAHTYEPFNAITHRVPKAGGGLRAVSVFQIADNAVSRRIFLSLISKNRSKMSAQTYAYRRDISAHDAIRFVAGDLRDQSRIFIAEYDFSKYFDNISHEHIWKTLHDRQFLFTYTEKRIIERFLQTPTREPNDYVPRGGTHRQRGVPQGTSISLFLANIAAWDLDRALERLGVSFVRYADDTLIWSPDYSQICRAVETLHDMSELIGAPINIEKSGGIRLLARHGSPSEMPAADHVEFLGHSVSLNKLSIKDSLVRKLKAHVNRLLYFNIIREALRGTQRPGRRYADYMTFVWQLRRYLYGDIGEQDLLRLQRERMPPRRFRGFMSFFPLVDDDDQLRAIDRWIECQTRLALRRREILLGRRGTVPSPGAPGPGAPSASTATPGAPGPGAPSTKPASPGAPGPGAPSASTATPGAPTGNRGYDETEETTDAPSDLQLPSLYRIGQVIRRAVKRYGTNRVTRRAFYDD
ncbi:reverse transcriptase domain-containing protein [Sorangium sp. So ce406]|uniref:reverse transcriptase domain-containing protein n=1 Tax=Sorangium sp. So ce406 TaxID=3133311 RepID=UPI003F5BD946